MNKIVRKNIKEIMKKNENFEKIINYYRYDIRTFDDLIYLMVFDSGYCISSEGFKLGKCECDCLMQEEEIASCCSCWVNYLRTKHKGIDY